MTKPRQSWQLRDARAHFSTLVDKALSEGPQIVTRNGKKTVVVVSAREWERHSHRKVDLVEFFAGSPLRGEDIKIERKDELARDIAL
jgi:prevent-host-death family protein